MKQLRAGKSINRRLLRLNSQGEATDADLFVWLNDRALFARDLAAGNQRWIAAFWNQPVTTLIVQGKRRVHAADFRIAFQGKIDCDRARAAADRNLGFRDLDD